MNNDLTLGEFVAVDPSIRCAGIAAFRGGKLLAASAVKASTDTAAPMAERCFEMAQALARWIVRYEVAPRVLILEWPQIYTVSKSKGDPNDLIGLAGVGMALAGIVGMGVAARDLVLQVTSYTPAEWAGQLPKSTKVSGFAASPRTKRIRSRLDAAELAAIAEVASHDAFDAIGIGLHALGRLDPVRIFPGAS